MSICNAIPTLLYAKLQSAIGRQQCWLRVWLYLMG